MNLLAYFGAFGRRRVIVGLLCLILATLMAALAGTRTRPDLILLSFPGFFAAQVLVEPLRRLQQNVSFGVVVPGLVRSVRWSFVLSVVMVSSLFGWVGHFGSAHLSGFALGMWDALVIGMVLLLNTGPREAWLLVAAAVAMFLAGEAKLVELMQAVPWPFSLVAAGFAAWALQTGTDTRRYLTRLLPAHTSRSGKPYAWFRPTMPGAKGYAALPPLLRRFRINEWVQIAAFENRTRSMLKTAAAIPFIGLLPVILTRQHGSERWSNLFYLLVNPTAFQGDSPAGAQVLMFIFGLALVLAASAGLRTMRVYPVSRRQRADVCFRRLLAVEAFVAAGWLLSQGVCALGLWAIIRPSGGFPTVPWFVYEAGLLLGAVPLAYAFSTAPRKMNFFPGLLLGALALTFVGTWLSLSFSAVIYHPPTLLTAVIVGVAVPVVAHLITWWRLRRYYDSSDLVFESDQISALARLFGNQGTRPLDPNSA